MTRTKLARDLHFWLWRCLAVMQGSVGIPGDFGAKHPHFSKISPKIAHACSKWQIFEKRELCFFGNFESSTRTTLPHAQTKSTFHPRKPRSNGKIRIQVWRGQWKPETLDLSQGEKRCHSINDANIYWTIRRKYWSIERMNALRAVAMF